MEQHTLFIGGLPNYFTEQECKSHFAQFGQITKLNLVKKKNSTITKGYGFVTFKSEDSLKKAISQPIQKIKGRIVDCQRAAASCKGKKPRKQMFRLFIGRIQKSTSTEELETYFSQFGTVRQAYLIKDPKTLQNKTYGYIVFSEEASLERALKKEQHFVKGDLIYFKDTRTQENTSPSNKKEPEEEAIRLSEGSCSDGEEDREAPIFQQLRKQKTPHFGGWKNKKNNQLKKAPGISKLDTGDILKDIQDLREESKEKPEKVQERHSRMKEVLAASKNVGKANIHQEYSRFVSSYVPRTAVRWRMKPQRHQPSYYQNAWGYLQETESLQVRETAIVDGLKYTYSYPL